MSEIHEAVLTALSALIETIEDHDKTGEMSAVCGILCAVCASLCDGTEDDLIAVIEPYMVTKAKAFPGLWDTWDTIEEDMRRVCAERN